MKRIRKILALILALCMVLSLTGFTNGTTEEEQGEEHCCSDEVSHEYLDSVTTNEEDEPLNAMAREEQDSGTVGNSDVTWSFSEADGRLTISGYGDAPRFESKEDQPWAAFRDRIKKVVFSPMADLEILDLAYWFTDCIALEETDIPYTTQIIGTDAFAGCPNLKRIIFYYQDDSSFYIEDGAFYTNVEVDTTLYVIAQYTLAVLNLRVHDWKADNRNISFEDVYGMQEVAAGCFSNCACGSSAPCQKGTNSVSTSYSQFNDSSHKVTFSCSCCSGSFTSIESHTSGTTCSKCGYSSGSSGGGSGGGCSHSSSTYSYSYYSSSQHYRERYCALCGAYISSTLQSHSATYSYTQKDATSHIYSGYCSSCKSTVSSVTQSHSLTTKAEKYSATQHKLTQSCSDCGYSATSYVSHSDGNGDGNCDDCSYTMAATVKWDYGDGRSTTTSQTYNASLVLPTTPTRDGYTFLGWFTAASGGTQVTSSTTFTASSPTTYYAQWELIPVFSVTVPGTLPLAMAKNGQMYAPAASIVNHSTAAVQVTAVKVTPQNGWKLAAFDTNMSRAKVDSKQVGFSINGAKTVGTTQSQTLSIRAADWIIPLDGSLALDYDAVVSAMSQPVNGQSILSVVFVLNWA